MTDPNVEPQKGWEKFDEVSLKQVTITDEEESPKNKEPMAKEESKATNVKEENIQDPLQNNPRTHSDTETKPSSPGPEKPTYETRSPPISPVPCMPIIKPKPIFLNVNRLEEGVQRIAKASVISDPQNVNGKVLATVFPDNLVCDWVTPPHYDAYSMPSILAIDVPTLTGEDYITTIKTIVEDYRFKLYSTIYARLIALWMVFWILSLVVTLLLSTKGGWPVMIFCLVWAVFLFVGIYVCAMIRRRIRIALNHVVEKANKLIVDRHFLTGVEDRGQLSCHKVVIHFIRFNVGECTAEVIKQLKIQKSGGCVFGGNGQEEPNDESIEREAATLILQYSQEYVKSVVKKRLIFPSKPLHGVSSYAPKHCKTQMCLCQFIDEKKFNAKPKKWYVKYI
uniref:MSC domain-containing protein n=1 Tax=Caenorhabditis tropicalis TaxID=1561998 RepID=A0A1I7T783_9PELO